MALLPPQTDGLPPDSTGTALKQARSYSKRLCDDPIQEDKLKSTLIVGTAMQTDVAS